MFSYVRSAALTVVLAGSLCGQAPAPADPAKDPPKPGCDPYSMQTLPKDAFGIKQRTCFWSAQLFTGSAFFGASLFGAVGEWRHKPAEWPQGWDGFGRQAGTRYTQGMVKSTATFIASTISREDPRPKPPPFIGMSSERFGCRPSTTFKGRLGQSLLRVVWNACEPNGWRRPAPGRLIGSFASGFVGLAWAPPSQDKTSIALTNSGTAFAGYIGSSVFSEFQNDLFGLLGKMFPAGKPQSQRVPPKTPPAGGPPSVKGSGK